MLLLGVASGFMFAGGARAQSSSAATDEGITIVPSDCEQTPWTGLAWAELVRVELTATGRFVEVTVAEDTSSPADASQSVSIGARECSAESSATITVRGHGRQATRVVDLAQIDEVARARVLAIAAAELVRSDLLEPAPGGETKSSSTPRRQAAAPVTVRTEKPRSSGPAARGVSLFASGEARLFVQDNATLFGGRGGALVPLTSWLSVEADAGALFGHARDPLGTVRSSLDSVGLGLLGVGGAGGASFGFGPRIEVGVASFDGQPYSAATRSGAITSPVVLFLLSVSACIPVVDRVSGFAVFDAGTSLYSFGARADNRLVSAVEGVTLSPRIGIALDVGAR